MAKYATDPALTHVLDATTSLVKQGRRIYGNDTIKHRFEWRTAIDGNAHAVVFDCMDDYNAGTMESKTGKKLTAGLHRDNTQIIATRQPDGTWLISDAQFLARVPC